jgi:hypothetical protein
MKATCFVLLMLVGCCHERSAVRTSEEVAAAGRKEAVVAGERRCQSNCALELALRQLPEESSIELEFRLANVSRDQNVWVSSRLRVEIGHPEHRTSEIELYLTDHNGRQVFEHCLALVSGNGLPAYTVLRPGQAVTGRYSMRPGCLLLDPGEVLNAVATYGAVDDGPDKPAGTVAFDQIVSTPSWQQIIVPKDWKGGTR